MKNKPFLEEILECISEMGKIYLNKSNEVAGPGFSSWKVKTREYSILQIKCDSEMKKVKYE